MPSRLYRSLMSLSLLILLGIPTVVPAIHEVLHEHHYLNCHATAAERHLHADIYHCRLCDYLSTVTFFNDLPPMLEEMTDLREIENLIFQSPLCEQNTGQQFLRGPPVKSA